MNLKIVIVGKSGVGKTTLKQDILLSTSLTSFLTVTSRSPRVGEVDGLSYIFTTQDKFKQQLLTNCFIEHTVFKGNYYGSRYQELTDRFVIIQEPEGALAFKAYFDDIVMIKLILDYDTWVLRNQKRKINRIDEERFEDFQSDFTIDMSGTRVENLNQFLKFYRRLL